MRCKNCGGEIRPCDGKHTPIHCCKGWVHADKPWHGCPMTWAEPPGGA